MQGTSLGHSCSPSTAAISRSGLSLGLFNPRYSSGYGDLRHLPTVLVENHSLKPYRQRVLGTRVLFEASLEALGKNASIAGCRRQSTTGLRARNAS